MRSTTVPAQITSLEDMVTDRLSITQLMLLIAPLIIGVGIYVGLPPMFGYANYKTVLIIIVAAITATLAIRVRGIIIMNWIVILFRYSKRPRYHIYDKNSSYLRQTKQKVKQMKSSAVRKKEPRKTLQLPNITIAERVQAEKVITDPRANFYLRKDRKGRMKVHVTEIK